MSEEEKKQINEIFSELKKKAEDCVTLRLGYFEVFTGKFKFDVNNYIYVDIEIFDELKASNKLTKEQKQYLLQKEFNGVRPSTTYDEIY